MKVFHYLTDELVSFITMKVFHYLTDELVSFITMKVFHHCSLFAFISIILCNALPFD